MVRSVVKLVFFTIPGLYNIFFFMRFIFLGGKATLNGLGWGVFRVDKCIFDWFADCLLWVVYPETDISRYAAASFLLPNKIDQVITYYYK